ncbi:MAG TPA: 4a-hydroxytetrahydrobiopterin dehydratase, partial [Acidimicrobiales bacterium]|nr:4a-hydroxytetrahydrobiopterin dehydratase [Acidimicrobiales bacterium]
AMELLDLARVDETLAGGLGWRRDGNELVKMWSGKDFAAALAYVDRVGALAEEANHHPDIDIRWNKVTLRLSTHSAGGLTQRDLDLARRIDALGTLGAG